MGVQERGREKRRREAVDECEYKKEDGRRGEEKEWRGDIVLKGENNEEKQRNIKP